MAPALIMVIAFFMILEQLQIAPDIVRIAFTAIMFALALGLALAFGLGGRDLAADALRQAKDKGADAAGGLRYALVHGSQVLLDRVASNRGVLGARGPWALSQGQNAEPTVR